MHLYLTQHGLAVPEAVDPDRPLSEQGRRDVRRLADRLGTIGVRADRVLHSGKARAARTAEILADALLPHSIPELRPGLAPKDPVEALAAEISDWSRDTLIVGHLPFLSRLASLLLAADPDRPMLAFLPGSIACLERQPEGHWTLAWMIRPELLV